LFQIADKGNKGKLQGKDAAEFLKKSNLSKETLKQIWIIAAQTDASYLEKDEFYISLRLVALAQNNMEVSEDSIRLNNPLPPLPVFDLKTKPVSQSVEVNPSNNMGNMMNMGVGTQLNTTSVNSKPLISEELETKFKLLEEDINKYQIIFTKNKDMKDKISFLKLLEMLRAAKIPNDKITKIINLVPTQEQTMVNFTEFKVIFQLVYKSFQSEVPEYLPECLRRVLYNLPIENPHQMVQSVDIDFGNKLGMNLTNLNNTNINSKPSDIESTLMNEFNLKPNSSNNVANNVIPQIPNTGFQFPQDNFNPAQVHVINQPTANLLNDRIQEQQYVNKILDDDRHVYEALTEEVDKFILQINQVHESNKLMKAKLGEIRRRVKAEKENFNKITINLSKSTNDLLQTQEEYLKVMEEYSDIKSRTQNQFSNNISPNKNIENSEAYMDDFNKIHNYHNQNNFNSSKSNNVSSTNLQNPNNFLGFNPTGNQNTFNKSFDNAPEKETPKKDIGFNFETSQKSEFVTSYPRYESIIQSPYIDPSPNVDKSGSNGFNFENPQSKFTNNQLSDENMTNENLRHPEAPARKDTDFDFDFDGDVQGGFKQFAQKKGEDLFNKNNMNNDGWDF
jgi:hypothetical protein